MNTNRLPPPLPGKKRRQCHESTLLRKESKAIHLARTPSLPVEYVGLEQARLSFLDAELKERIAHGLRSMPHLEDVSPWVSSRLPPSKSGPISAASTPQPLSFRTFPPPSVRVPQSLAGSIFPLFNPRLPCHLFQVGRSLTPLTTKKTKRAIKTRERTDAFFHRRPTHAAHRFRRKARRGGTNTPTLTWRRRGSSSWLSSSLI